MKWFSSSLVSLVLVLVILASSLLPTVALAEAPFYGVNSNKYCKTYMLSTSGRTTTYTSSDLSRPGTENRASDTAYIDNSADEIWILEARGSALRVSYPVGSSRYIAWIHASSVTNASIYSNCEVMTSSGRFYCAARQYGSLSGSYYVDQGDRVQLIATSGNRVQIMYPTGNQCYRLAWADKADYDRYCKGTAYPTIGGTAASSGNSGFPNGIYMTQAGSTTCTLCAAAMMLRAKAYQAGRSDWSSITESAIKSTAWVNGDGLRWNFTYGGMTVSHRGYNGISLNELKSLLNSNPAGVVLYCGSLPHAVFVMGYSGDTILCADPVSSYSGRQISLANSSLGSRIGNQSAILSSVTAIWFVR